MKKFLLLLLSALISLGAYAQSGGMKGQVVSREGREPIGGVIITIDSESRIIKTNSRGEFYIEGLAPDQYLLSFEAPDFETLEVMVRVKELVHDMQAVIMVPESMDTVDNSAFVEYDTDVESFGDSKALPQLSASKDLFNNIASYRFSEMRFNVRGYDSQYQDVYLNGIRFNDALTSYGPWSLWSGMNDADIVVLVVDAKKGFDDQTQSIVSKLNKNKIEAVLVLNKVDLIQKEKLLELSAKINATGNFSQTFMVSALTGQNIEDFYKYLADNLPESPWYYPEDQISDMPLKLLTAEVVREKLFLYLRQELPLASLAGPNTLYIPVRANV